MQIPSVVTVPPSCLEHSLKRPWGTAPFFGSAAQFDLASAGGNGVNNWRLIPRWVQTLSQNCPVNAVLQSVVILSGTIRSQIMCLNIHHTSSGKSMILLQGR